MKFPDKIRIFVLIFNLVGMGCRPSPAPYPEIWPSKIESSGRCLDLSGAYQCPGSGLQGDDEKCRLCPLTSYSPTTEDRGILIIRQKGCELIETEFRASDGSVRRISVPPGDAGSYTKKLSWTDDGRLALYHTQYGEADVAVVSQSEDYVYVGKSIDGALVEENFHSDLNLFILLPIPMRELKAHWCRFLSTSVR